MYQRINHVSITVKDVEKVVAWFRDVLGMTHIWEPYEYEGKLAETFTGLPGAHLRVKKVQLGDFVLEFIQYLSPRGKELKGNTNDVGYPHIGIVVDNVEETYKTLKPKGVRFKSAPVEITDKGNPMCGWRIVYLWGPEDMTLEFVEAPK